jgi:hypothetical protein
MNYDSNLKVEHRVSLLGTSAVIGKAEVRERGCELIMNPQPHFRQHDRLHLESPAQTVILDRSTASRHQPHNLTQISKTF